MTVDKILMCRGENMVLNPEERKILLIKINGQKVNPDEVKEINVPEKNDCVWEFTFKDDSILNATGNVIVKYI